MRIALLLTAAVTTAVAGAPASVAQTTQQSSNDIPKACQDAAQASGEMQPMEKMQSQMKGMMQSSMQGMQMTETQKGLHQAMMNMNGPMMQGMMAKDADVAWICSMIPHHQGAIAMAGAGLLGADNAESKKLAEETIQSNEKELKKLIACFLGPSPGLSFLPANRSDEVVLLVPSIIRPASPEGIYRPPKLA